MAAINYNSPWPSCGCTSSFRKRKRTAGDGAPLALALKKNIIHTHFGRSMTPEEIAPLIKSPRREGGIHVRTVKIVIAFFEVFGHVERLRRGRRRLKMAPGHIKALILLVRDTPWLFLDEIAAELLAITGVAYLPGLCSDTLKAYMLSLKNMRRVARQRDEFQRHQYFVALSKIMWFPEKLVFSDEVGQDGRGSRRRRGWAPVGAPCDILEFLERGKHISILALYGITGFLNFDYLEGGYNAEDFMTAVQFTRGPVRTPLRLDLPLGFFCSAD